MTDFIGIVHPWTYFICIRDGNYKYGQYCYIWKARVEGQDWADYKGYGINEKA